VLAFLGVVVQQVWPRHGPPRSVGREAVAAATFAVSAGLAGGAAAQFRAAHTTVEPFEPSKATSLVVTGPNSLTRNPMYVGMAGLLTANAVRRGTWQAVLPLAAFVTWIDRFQVAAEEEALAQKFGADYEAYRAAVPRWLDLRSLVR
jgi:protein-S-isoprenylcysteine O-methyltransferase Ste14